MTGAYIWESSTVVNLSILSFKIGIGIPIPTVKVAPYPVKEVPLSHLELILFRSPIRAKVPAGPLGIPFLVLFTLGLCWVPLKATYPIPPPKKILVPMPMVS